MGFPDRHHRGEDAVIWPELLRRDPGLTDLLTRMTSDHHSIEPRLKALRAAAEGLTAGTTSAREVVAALDCMTELLLPHLKLEEERTMAEAGRLLTNFGRHMSALQPGPGGRWWLIRPGSASGATKPPEPGG